MQIFSEVFFRDSLKDESTGTRLHLNKKTDFPPNIAVPVSFVIGAFAVSVKNIPGWLLAESIV